MIVGGRVKLTATGRALKHRNFRFFFFGQLISVTGTWMQSVAQALLVLNLVGPKDGPVALGLIGAVQFIPVMILGLFGGMIADLWPKRRTIVVTQIASGLLALILAVLAMTGTVQVWHVFALGLILGIVNAVDMPTRQSFVVEMVGRDDVANAVALNSAVFNGARIIGPVVAGVLIAIVGVGWCFTLNAISYVAVVVGLLMMRDGELLPSPLLAMPHSIHEAGRDLAEGLSYVRRTPVVLLVVGMVGVVSTFGMNFNVIVPALGVVVLKLDPFGVGALYSAMGVGALIAALIAASSVRPRLRLLIGGALVMGASEVALSFTTSFPVALACIFFAGLGAVAMAATANSLIQVTVPGPLRGRVMSVYTTVFVGSTPAGNAFTGGLAGGFGTPLAILVDGAVSILGAGAAAAVVLRGAVPTAEEPEDYASSSA